MVGSSSDHCWANFLDLNSSTSCLSVRRLSLQQINSVSCEEQTQSKECSTYSCLASSVIEIRAFECSDKSIVSSVSTSRLQLSHAPSHIAVDSEVSLQSMHNKSMVLSITPSAISNENETNRYAPEVHCHHGLSTLRKVLAVLDHRTHILYTSDFWLHDVTDTNNIRRSVHQDATCCFAIATCSSRFLVVPFDRLQHIFPKRKKKVSTLWH